MQLLGTGHQRAGKSSMIGINNDAQILAFASWDVTVQGEDLPTVNFTSFVSAPTSFGTSPGQSFGEGILGVVEADVRFGGAWDAGMNPYDNPPGLYPRDDLSTVNFYVSRPTLDNTYYLWDYLRLRSAHNTSDVRGLIGFDVGGKNQGQFVLPTGDN
ncbi:MAG: hypothetical protein KGL39_40675 [Patescibacteria group bacterium]|nr:hypothetical protein [Patescibacteria group bacterium]